MPLHSPARRPTRMSVPPRTKTKTKDENQRQRTCRLESLHHNQSHDADGSTGPPARAPFINFRALPDSTWFHTRGSEYRGLRTAATEK